MYDKDTANELAYDNAIDDILTGDIHLVPPVGLFSIIHKRMDDSKREMLDDVPVLNLHTIWETRLFKDPLEILPF